jgi:endonuclease/exonuclease/phosphatase family metal-dependent hydrolase
MIRVLALLLLLTAPAMAADLKISTWNMEWLTLRPAGDPALPENVVPKQPADFALLRRYARMLDADVVAFQEVDGAAPAARIFPPDRYTIIVTDDSVIQRVGFAIRLGLAFERNPDLVALDPYPQAIFHLRSGADITLILPGGRLRLLNVHLKSGCHEGRLGSGSRVCDTLRRQVAPLQGWITQRVQEGTPFVLLGDFNRRMDRKDELLDALNAASPLSRATEGQATGCWGGNSFIDHIMAGGRARGWMQQNSLRVLVYAETDPAAREHLSDHCPVSVRFRVPD